MNKQINSINGYSCVKVQFYDFLLFTRAERSTCDVLTHAFYSPTHPKILYEALPGKGSGYALAQKRNEKSATISAKERSRDKD